MFDEKQGINGLTVEPVRLGKPKLLDPLKDFGRKRPGLLSDWNLPRDNHRRLLVSKEIIVRLR